MNKLILFLSLNIFITPVFAYIGPGMGGGVVVAVLAFVAAMLIGFWGILYYPIKRALKNRKDKKMSLKNSNKDSN
tara:strand:+ start:2979 stop:3203 length:225 start_codon:yes stop_codon:yes gene_type:complete